MKLRTSSSFIEPLEARIAPASCAVVDLSDLDGNNGFAISGLNGSRGGAFFTVSDAGDVNGDGIADLLVGELYNERFSGFYGSAAVIFGKADRFSPAFELADLDGTNGFRLGTSDRAAQGQSFLGTSLSAAGDVNGDGYGDVIVASPGSKDVSYVVFGRATGFPAGIDCAKLNGADGFAVVDDLTTRTGFQYGLQASGAGDLNADGFDDVIMGWDNGAYVVFGKAGAFTATVNRSALDGANGFDLKNSGAIRSLSGAGDVNGDQIQDVIIGSSQTYVVFGSDKPFSKEVDVAALNGSNGFTLLASAPDDSFGTSVSTAGDVNGDGLDDVIIGAPTADANASDSGASYVFFGRGTPFPPVLSASELNGSNGFRLSGVVESDHAGTSVSGAGDLNGDGLADLLIGAPGVDGTAADTGAVYVVFGKAAPFAADLSLAALDEASGLTLRGGAGGNGASDRAGASVSVAGDVNGDGVGDIIVSYARSYSFGGPTFTDSGAFVVFGYDPQIVPVINISDVTIAETHTGTVAASFTVRLAAPSHDIVTVQYATADGTAKAPGDYTALNLTTLTFAPCELSKTVTVNVNGDTDLETDESFFVNLSAPTNASIGKSQGKATIIDDDAFPEIFLQESAFYVFEEYNGESVVWFSVRLSHPTGRTVSVDYATQDGSAVAPGDYTPVKLSTLTFEPGEGVKSVRIPIVGDNIHEAPDPETFFFHLSSPDNATLRDTEGQVSIADNDPIPTVSGSYVVVSERADGVNSAVFTINLSSPTTEYVSVQYATADGSAVAPGDYTPVPLTTVGFEPGEVTKQVLVSINPDQLAEGRETFVLNLSEPINAIVGGGGYAEIVDPPFVKLSPSGKRATFSDVDGDLVTVKTTKGAFTLGDFVFSAGERSQLQMLDLAGDTAFAGAKIKVVATRPTVGTSDGFVDLGYFNATGVDVKTVTIDGDLGQIDAGNGDGTRPALKSLIVDSLGARRLETQGSDGSLQSDLDGDLLSLSVRRDVSGATLTVLGRLGIVAIRGDLGFARIIARGELLPGSSAEAQAIANIAVQGDVFSSQILAGYATAGSAVNADAGIGAVFVKGGWNASSIAAGIVDATGDGFGRNDALISGGAASIIARIASVKIHGAALGSAAPGDHFGITAGQIGKAKIGGVSVALTPGPNDALLDPLNDDFRLVDFA